MNNTRLAKSIDDHLSLSPFPSVDPTDLLQGLRGGVLLSSPLLSGQECVTRRFSNPLSITIPGVLVLLVPFDSRRGSARAREKKG